MLILSLARDVNKDFSLSDLQHIAVTSLLKNVNNLFANFYSLASNQSFLWHDLSGQDLIIQHSYLPLAITQEEFTSLLDASCASIFVNSHILSIYSLKKIFISSTVIPCKNVQSLDFGMFPLYVNRSVLDEFLSHVSKDTSSNLSGLYRSLLGYLLKVYPVDELVTSAFRCLNIVYPAQLNPPSASLQRQDRTLSISNLLFQSTFPHYANYIRFSSFFIDCDKIMISKEPSLSCSHFCSPEQFLLSYYSMSSGFFMDNKSISTFLRVDSPIVKSLSFLQSFLSAFFNHVK